MNDYRIRIRKTLKWERGARYGGYPSVHKWKWSIAKPWNSPGADEDGYIQVKEGYTRTKKGAIRVAKFGLVKLITPDNKWEYIDD